MCAFFENSGGGLMTRSPLLSAMVGLLLRDRGSGTLAICYSFANPMGLQIDVIRISPARGEPLPLPAYATEGAAGVDLRADVAVTLGPGGRALLEGLGRPPRPGGGSGGGGPAPRGGGPGPAFSSTRPAGTGTWCASDSGPWWRT